MKRVKDGKDPNKRKHKVAKNLAVSEQDAELLETGKTYDVHGNRLLPEVEDGASQAELESMTTAWLAQAKRESQVTKNPKKSGKRRKN